MKKLVTAMACTTALASSMLLAPAFAQLSSSPSNKTTSVSNERYCYKERLYTAGGEMSCNWTTSAAEACRDFSETSRISANAMTEPPRKSTRCANGEWLVQVTLK